MSAFPASPTGIDGFALPESTLDIVGAVGDGVGALVVALVESVGRDVVAEGADEGALVGFRVLFEVNATAPMTMTSTRPHAAQNHHFL
jgi:hypothetical protein